MKINDVFIDDAVAEAFEAPYAKLCISARSGGWALDAATTTVGCATSIIACGCEAGIEAREEGYNTPDSRPGHDLLFFAKSQKKLKKELIKRVGQVCLPTPTLSVFNSLESGEPFALGEKIGFFGNGFQREVTKFGRKVIAVPTTAGEFLVEKSINIGKGVGGANFWIYAKSEKSGLRAAEKAVEAIKPLPGLILPFVGGIVASPSRVGSLYKELIASTQEDFCPTIGKDKNPNRKVPEGVGAIFEIIIDAVSIDIARKALSLGINASCIGGVEKIGAANFGGEFGTIKIPIRETL